MAVIVVTFARFPPAFQRIMAIISVIMAVVTTFSPLSPR